MSDRLPRIVGSMDEEHAKWRTLVADLGEFESTRRQRERWSPVDTLIHVTAWKDNALRIARSQAEAGASIPDASVGSAPILGLEVDDFNAETLRTHEGWTLERALAWSDEVHRDLLDAIRRLPADRLIVPEGPHGIVGWLLLPAIEHPPEHRLRLERQLGYTP